MSPCVRASFTFACLLPAVACGSDGTGPGESGGATVSSVEISPPAATLTSLGETLQLTAVARDPSGIALSGVSVTWTSSNAEVASVSDQGLVTARANGGAQVTARAGGKAATASVTVAQVPASLTLSHESALVTLGESLELVADVRDAGGRPLTDPDVQWTSSDSTIAAVDGDGVVTPRSLGMISVRATVGDLSETATIQVVSPESSPLLRAIFIGGNWGPTTTEWATQPQEFYRFLADLNVNWAGVSVALHYDDSMDATVERVYSGVQIPTFSDEALRALIRGLRSHGINVYLTLAFEAFAAEDATKPVYRWQLGDSQVPVGVTASDWPWSPTHPQHDTFVREFWRSYTEQAVHFARLAQEEDVGMFSLGTETDRLFRTRASTEFSTEFRDELTSMVSEVRAVFHGTLTYDQGYDVLLPSGDSGGGPQGIWSDLGLDLVGISAYFPLTTEAPTSVLTVSELEAEWGRIFRDYLLPLQQRNPGIPVAFTEFGYVDDVASPYQPNSGEFTTRVFVDKDGNGLDDGQETQANIYEAFFKARARYPVIQGAFLWDHPIADDALFEASWGQMRTFSVRGKPAAARVRSVYSAWR